MGAVLSGTRAGVCRVAAGVRERARHMVVRRRRTGHELVVCAVLPALSVGGPGECSRRVLQFVLRRPPAAPRRGGGGERETRSRWWRVAGLPRRHAVGVVSSGARANVCRVAASLRERAWHMVVRRRRTGHEFVCVWCCLPRTWAGRGSVVLRCCRRLVVLPPPPPPPPGEGGGLGCSGAPHLGPSNTGPADS